MLKKQGVQDTRPKTGKLRGRASPATHTHLPTSSPETNKSGFGTGFHGEGMKLLHSCADVCVSSSCLVSWGQASVPLDIFILNLSRGIKPSNP